jgi:hypothetical protein
MGEQFFRRFLCQALGSEPTRVFPE